MTLTCHFKNTTPKNVNKHAITTWNIPFYKIGLAIILYENKEHAHAVLCTCANADILSFGRETKTKGIDLSPGRHICMEQIVMRRYW